MARRASAIVGRSMSTTTAVKKSLIPAGAPLRGLNYLKDRTDPIAMSDAEYPEWLWTCIEPTSGKKKKKSIVPGDGGAAAAAAAGGGGSSSGPSMNATSEKAARKRAASSSDAASARWTVPLVEQSVDLPSNPEQDLEGAMQAAQARDELTKALRVKRRGSIKEANFLKGMN